MDRRKTTKLTELLDAYPPAVRDIARGVLNAELGKLHLKTAYNIKEEIRQIVELQAVKIEHDGRFAEDFNEA